MTAKQSSLRSAATAKHSSDRFLPLQQLSSLGTPGRGKGGTAEGDQEATEGPAGRSCCDAIVSRVGLDF